MLRYLNILAAAVTAMSVAGSPALAEPVASRAASTEARINALERRLVELEDLQRIHTLARAYTYYVSKGQFSEVMSLFTSNPSLEIAQAGVMIGPEATRKVFMMGMGMGRDCLAQGRLFNHFVLEPQITIAPGGRTATGRALMIGTIAFGPNNATIQQGLYDFGFEKGTDNVWRFSKLRFVSDLNISVPGGFSQYVPANPLGGPPRGTPGVGSDQFAGSPPGGLPPRVNLPPGDAPGAGAPGRGSAGGAMAIPIPDRPPTAANAGGFPETYVMPYEFPNPVTGVVPDVSTCNAPQK